MALEQLAFLGQQMYNCENPENLYAGVLSDIICSLQDGGTLSIFLCCLMSSGTRGAAKKFPG